LFVLGTATQLLPGQQDHSFLGSFWRGAAWALALWGFLGWLEGRGAKRRKLGRKSGAGGTRKGMAASASASGERERERETAGGINGMADAEVGDRRGEKPAEPAEGRDGRKEEEHLLR